MRKFTAYPNYIKASNDLTHSYGELVESAVSSSQISKFVESTKVINYSDDPYDAVVEVKLKPPYKCKYYARVNWFNDTLTIVPSRGYVSPGSPDKNVVISPHASLNQSVDSLNKLVSVIETQTQKYLNSVEAYKSKEQNTAMRKASDAVEYPLSDVELSIIQEAFDYMLRPYWKDILGYHDGNDRRSFISKVFHFANEKSKSMKLDGQLDARSKAWTKKPAVIRDRIEEYLENAGF